MPEDCFMEAVKLYELADLLIVPSKASAAVLIKQGYQEHKIRVIPHGLNYKYLSSIDDNNQILKLVPDNSTLILCPARAEGHKDPETFIRAASILKKKRQ